MTEGTIETKQTAVVEKLVLSKNFNALKEIYDNAEKFMDEVKFLDPDGDLATLVIRENIADYIRRTHRNDSDGTSDGYLGKRLTLNSDLTVDISDI